MDFLAVRFSSNYADEFQVEALWLATRQEFDSFMEELQKRDISEDSEIYFGTNEIIYFDSFSTIESAITITPISELTYDEMYDALDGTELGLISIPDLLYVYPLKEENE